LGAPRPIALASSVPYYSVSFRRAKRWRNLSFNNDLSVETELLKFEFSSHETFVVKIETSVERT